jgi:hypothetical protein
VTNIRVVDEVVYFLARLLSEIIKNLHLRGFSQRHYDDDDNRDDDNDDFYI